MASDGKKPILIYLPNRSQNTTVNKLPAQVWGADQGGVYDWYVLLLAC